MFFDKQAVLSAVDKATRQNLSKFGAFVRRRAKSSIRPASKKRTVSQPGNPPLSHTGLLRKWILFAWDPSSRSVVIGPTRISNQIGFTSDMKVTRGTVPSVLEYGGGGGVIEKALQDPATGKLAWVRRNLRTNGSVFLVATLRKRLASGQALQGINGAIVVPAGKHRFRTYRVAARPYMRPAFEAELKKLPSLWANSVRRSP